MALNFNSIEPVKFGEVIATPRVDEEQKLKIQSLIARRATIKEFAPVLAQCFEEREYVETFILDNFCDLDIEYLSIYLIRGQRGVDLLDQALHDQMNEISKLATSARTQTVATEAKNV